MHREGTDVRQHFQQDGKAAITSGNEKTGEVYLALFNLNDEGISVIDIPLKDLGIENCRVTEMWSDKEVDQKGDKISCSLQPHASVLYKLTPEK